MDLKQKSRTKSFPWMLVLVLTCILGLYLWRTRPAPPLEGWGTDYEAARAEALTTRRTLLIAFYLDGCGYCDAMDRTVLNTGAVRSALKDYVPVRLNLLQHDELSHRFAVYAAPTFIVLDPNEKLLGRSEGYQPAAAFISFLERAATAAVPPENARFPS